MMTLGVLPGKYNKILHSPFDQRYSFSDHPQLHWEDSAHSHKIGGKWGESSLKGVVGNIARALSAFEILQNAKMLRRLEIR